MLNKRKLLKAFIIFAFLLCLSQIQAVTNFKPKYGVTTATVNFRNVPTTKYGIIGKVYKGSNIKIVGQIDDFYIVQLKNNVIGYISSDYIKNTTSVLPSLTYTNLTKTTGIITGSVVNIRGGPSTKFAIRNKTYKNDKVTVIGKISDFYLVVYSDNKVGMIQEDLVSIVKTSSPPTSYTPNDKVVLNYINYFRRDNNIPDLKMNSSLVNIATLKANDMVKYNYFSHNSITYGSPFTMMKNYGISYTKAGENLAGNDTIKKVVDSWINSPTHRVNLLNPYYNYSGISVVKSPLYGYIVVAEFIDTN